MKKRMLSGLALLLILSGWNAAAATISVAPGAACYAWNVDTINKPNTVPIGGFVDESVRFHLDNVYRQDGLTQLNRKAFIMWEGYLRVPKDGQYRMTLVANRNNIRIFLNNREVLSRREGRDPETVAGSVTLKAGMTPIRIYFNGTFGVVWGVEFQLKYGRANGMKLEDITPAMLYHQLEEEEE